MNLSRTTATLALALLATACGARGVEVDPTTVPARTGTVIVEGCSLDDAQGATLASAGARRVLQNVVLLCLDVGLDGTVAPADPAVRDGLRAQVATLQGLGYHVTVGFTFADALGRPYGSVDASAMLTNGALRQSIVDNLTPLADLSDGLEIALPEVGNAARQSLTAFVTALAAAVRPRHQLGLFAPPSIAIPSDLPGGDAYNLAALAGNVDRVRLMTLDFSCCGAGPGPTIDAGWAVDAARLAMRDVDPARLDVSFPLYGTDFAGGNGDGDQAITYADAQTLATSFGAAPTREVSGALHFAYTADGRTHTVWYDDARSALRTLAAWSTDVLPAGVGVTFYGLGAEDPALWNALAGAEP